MTMTLIPVAVFGFATVLAAVATARCIRAKQPIWWFPLLLTIALGGITVLYLNGMIDFGLVYHHGSSFID